MKTESIQYNDRPCAAIGRTALLNRHKIALFCSRKCPAGKIMEAYDQFKVWSTDLQVTIISGFHSPVEKECFKLLLAGKANIILCPAREIEHLRILKEWQLAIYYGRMLIISPFKEKRADKQSTFQRNELVAQLADELYVPYVSPDSDLNRIIDKENT
ncbi:MAG: hypothetical protein R6V06_10350 [Kiritimatiellia bacterium]